MSEGSRSGWQAGVSAPDAHCCHLLFITSSWWSCVFQGLVWFWHFAWEHGWLLLGLKGSGLFHSCRPSGEARDFLPKSSAPILPLPMCTYCPAGHRHHLYVHCSCSPRLLKLLHTQDPISLSSTDFICIFIFLICGSCSCLLLWFLYYKWNDKAINLFSCREGELA